MGKSKGKKKPSKGNNSNNNGQDDGGPMIHVDPARVRFQHSRIRPHFSGCGRSVLDTLEEIREGRLRPSDLPPIQVIVGPVDSDDGLPWYFSLNNRRLWVLKRCREEGLLENSNNTIAVRVRQPKSAAEQSRYSLNNCALEAKFMNEKREQSQQSTPQDDVQRGNGEEDVPLQSKIYNKATTEKGSSKKQPGHRRERDDLLLLGGGVSNEDKSDDDDDDSSSNTSYRPSNPFYLLS